MITNRYAIPVLNFQDSMALLLGLTGGGCIDGDNVKVMINNY